ncbi:bifunctional transcriptional activator/DNA repair enzyme AdaA [Pseudalkalibacillus decolorationis]|uniref:bifunctional transcriptional activator/DNA repair enzyme AdaA n=1 Tax=Pseudalkalibacillus decolorationis TaxID=163879 RepID=UPI0021482FAF|nr:Ada metal-binding domain-containing protein [Pseudalkalibacillus decolorationis]
MKLKTELSHDDMWKAIITCDSTYDGKFFYGVSTTGIFCRPSCKSKNPKYDNVSFFYNSNEAIHEGYRPCKRCQSDLNQETYHPAEEIVKNTKLFLEQNYKRNFKLDELSLIMGVSGFYLNRIFKDQTGLTPRIFLETLKIKCAKELLLKTSLSVTEICYQVGFKSLSNFYIVFKKNIGVTPNKFRKGFDD